MTNMALLTALRYCQIESGGAMAQNEHWKDLPHEDVDDATAAANVSQNDDPHDPVAIGLAFVNALSGDELVDPSVLVTPESIGAWGDFGAAREALLAIEGRGFGSIADRAVDAEDVAYFKILAHVDQSFRVTEGDVVMMAGVVTLVWRPEFDRWMVHALGDRLRPEDVPRTSPDNAPA